MIATTREATSPSLAQSAHRVLMLVNADRQTDIERQRRGVSPRRDYEVLANHLGAEIHDSGSLGRSAAGRTLKRFLGRGAAQALSSLPGLRKYDIVFSDNEYTGLFMSLMLRAINPSSRHVMLAHHLTPRKKRWLARIARGGIDRLILHSQAQAELAKNVLKFTAGQIAVLPYQVDTAFWKQSAQAQGSPVVSTAGLECRDYETLLSAVEGLHVELVIAAASNWSSKRNTLSGRTFAPNVSVMSFDYVGLRALYGQSKFVVVPLTDIDFQAGITTVLEGMSMAKAVILTRTRGQQPVVVGPVWRDELSAWPDEGPAVEESSGIYVAPGDAAAWRAAISFLLANPDIAATLGVNGRRTVETELTVEQFGERFAKAIVGEDSG
jgi:hypothetical protein